MYGSGHDGRGGNVAGERVYGGRSAAQRRLDRRAQLLDAGLERFAADGWAAATVAGICRTAGLSPRYFYEHVDDREALFLAVVERIADEVEHAVRAAAATEGADPVQRARLVLDALARYFAADPRTVRVALIESLATPTLRARRRELLVRFSELATRLLTALRDHDAVAPTGPVSATAGHLLTGGLVELLIAWATDDTATAPSEAVDHLVALATAVARS